MSTNSVLEKNDHIKAPPDYEDERIFDKDEIKKLIQKNEQGRKFHQSDEQKKTILNHFWKLLVRKHSSGDLHSRLKTRKILGVGETDDGGVHRSKLSQILGHSDQLYVRLPYGLKAWQFTLALVYAALGLWAIVHPSHLFSVAVQTDVSHDFINLSVRLYGGALVSLSVLHWATINSQDRDSIRVTLLSSIVFFVIQFIASCWHVLRSYSSSAPTGTEPASQHASTSTYSTLRMLIVSLVAGLVDWYFLWHLTYRRTYGNKSSESRKND